MAQKNQYGNQYRKGHYKFKTPEERQEVFAKLCQHLREGLSMDCFPPLDKTCIAGYCKTFPLDFPADQINEAKRAGKLYWEREGKNSLHDKDFRDKTYQFIMMNKYGMSLNQNSNVNITTKDVKEMSEDELNEVVDG